jgi:hypothetical protein
VTSLDWSSILDRAAEIVGSYDTSVTLRQLFYRLVSEQQIPNSQATYKRLSSLTAKRRRAGTFPALIDRGRRIQCRVSFTSAVDAMQWLEVVARRDRTDGQDVALYLGVEKAGMVVQLDAWFGDPLGIPILPLGGYSSESFETDVKDAVQQDGRPAILLYAGDFDPSGEDIDRNFIMQTDCWKDVRRIALNADQVREHRLPVNPGNADDTRAAGFIERHGALMQVELDALPPETLRASYQDAINQYWDSSAYDAALAAEQAVLEDLRHAGDWLRRRSRRPR